MPLGDLCGSKNIPSPAQLFFSASVRRSRQSFFFNDQWLYGQEAASQDGGRMAAFSPFQSSESRGKASSKQQEATENDQENCQNQREIPGSRMALTSQR